MGRKKNIVREIEALGRYRVRDAGDHYAIGKRPGVNGERVKKDPAFSRTREQNAAFAQCAAAGRLLRKCLAPLLSDVRERTLNARVLQLMYRVQQCNPGPSPYQHVFSGLNDPKGLALLRGFHFLSGPPLGQLLLKAPELHNHRLLLSDLVANRDLAGPPDATHAVLQAGCLCIGPGEPRVETQFSAPLRFPLNDRVRQVRLGPLLPECRAGVRLYVLKLSFYRQSFRIRGAAGRALVIVEVEGIL